MMEVKLNGTEEPASESTPAQVWGYGILFVTVINMSAFAGVWVIPLMNKTLYKHVLMYLVSLAVGTLCGNALLSLIPEAQGIFLDEEGSDFIWKNMVVLAGIYLFFNTERILKIIGSHRRERMRKKRMEGSVVTQPSVQVTSMHNLDSNPDRVGYKFTSPTEALAMSETGREHADEELAGGAAQSTNAHEPAQENGKLLTAICQEKNLSPSDAYLKEGETDNHQLHIDVNHSHGNHGDHHQSNGHGHSHIHVFEGDNMIATVAYMIIFGDGLHNFIDGLAIGASFSNSIYQGISTSVAVICEEFPHELGDFAILLNSGMSVKQAVLANFLSACTCYVGLVIGIILGENFHASEWIFALAGGMFLYISLVDMLPEINNVGGGDPLHEDQRSLLIFFLQNAGLLTGFGIMLVLALFAGRIQI